MMTVATRLDHRNRLSPTVSHHTASGTRLLHIVCVREHVLETFLARFPLRLHESWDMDKAFQSSHFFHAYLLSPYTMVNVKQAKELCFLEYLHGWRNWRYLDKDE